MPADRAQPVTTATPPASRSAPADPVPAASGRSSVAPTPLLQAALALVPPSVTAPQLGTRFAATGARLDDGTAERLLSELADLGLVRAARRGRTGGVRYVPTTLGTRSLGAGLVGEAAIPLAELERLRTDLLSTIAHELRTPLTAIRTGVGLLREPSARPTPAQQATLLESIERNAERMQRLVGDILELSRFRSGSVALQLRRFGGAALAESAVAAIAPLAERHGQHLRLDLPASEIYVYGDRRRLEQALLNLLSNAQRFSPEGGTIGVRVAHRGADVAWSVSDKGPGIPDADQARLFERFFVGRNDRAGAHEGVGLGLPTTLAIAQAHGGSVEVVSEVGHGSTFTLVVPSAGPEDES